jgi:uncharacterized membrane protein
MKQKSLGKKVILGIAILSFFLFVVFMLTSYFKSKNSTVLCETCNTCSWNVSVFDIIPILVTLAIMIGAGAYYFMSQKIESKQENLKKNTSVILKLMNADEKKLIEILVNNNGKALQAQLTRLPGMNKVKSHRIVKKLIERGVIKIEKYGKTNFITLNDEIKEGLL